MGTWQWGKVRKAAAESTGMGQGDGSAGTVPVAQA